MAGSSLTASIAKELRSDQRLIEQVRDDRRAAAAQKHDIAAQRYTTLTSETLDSLVVAAADSATLRPSLFQEMRSGVMASSQRIQTHATHFLGETEEAAARALTERLRLQVDAIRDPSLERAEKLLAEAENRVEHLSGELQVQQHSNVALQRENERLKQVVHLSAIDRDAMIGRVMEAEARVAEAQGARAAAEAELARCQEELADLVAANEARSARHSAQRPAVTQEGMHSSRMTGDSALATAGALEAGILLTAAEQSALSPAFVLSGLSVPDESMYRSIIFALKKLVESERRRARLAASQVVKERGERAQAVSTILEAVREASVELAKQQQETLQSPGLSSDARQALLAGLLSEEAVLTALPSIIFPTGLDGRRIGAAASQPIKTPTTR